MSAYWNQGRAKIEAFIVSVMELKKQIRFLRLLRFQCMQNTFTAMEKDTT
ncbi:hypothetical protein RO3G_07758 [Rhizopus delemar RA 99-880]|uniref:Uncharacterized protein n=1 Tax=Rhizopus delemar (strain RA 99-880 / ATCC MYA-4621 / FGSC 9543 / NRRL 43880) TaxID=246409 RepID=I1C3M3_RHIO9|nr:hypothetical protein RO3G_07758 [Rhizopus delemar RA 99-880]|eukprot:EIE83053.1 hypothetical protein RO3G_07758 [Rhizopus delemar RA 99-880]